MKHSQNNQFRKHQNSTAAELIDQLDGFDGSPGQFLQNILAVQCFLSQADAGAILRSNEERGVEVLAVYPPLEKGATAPVWLSQSVDIIRDALSEDVVVVKPLDQPNQGKDSQAQGYLLVCPLKLADIGPAVAAFLIQARNEAILDQKREKLELFAKLLGLLEVRPMKQRQLEGLRQLQRAIETLSVINRQNRFASAAMAFCNEVASQWQCERASVGFLRGRYVQLKAMSHTEDFSRKMKLVEDIESTMEECLDQDVEIVSPASKEATYIVRAADQLSSHYGPLAVLSLPLRRDGEAIGVVTLERPIEKAFSLGEIETFRLTCELCTARLASLYEHDQWVGARAAARARSLMAELLGPKHTWAKVGVIVSFAAILFLIFGKGQFRIKAPFVLEATYQQVVPAPFDGYIKSVEVEIGEMVKGDKSILGKLDTSELRLRLAAAKAEKHGYLKQASAAMRDGETAQAQIAQANADKASAQIDLLNYLIDQASLISPTSGTVVKGDLKREIGAPVKTGDVLFEVAPLDSLRAELLIAEDEIFDIKLNQQGYLATASYPGQRIKFVVERINPMAEVVKQRNVFKVRVQLLEIHPWMRPGMEGVAKVSVGKRHYIWIWTRKIVNWVRMKLWL